MKFIGIDLHSDNLKGHCIDLTEQQNPIHRNFKALLTGESFENFKKSLSKDDYVLIECSTNAFWFFEQIAPFVKECFVYETNKARREGNKTDIIDAEHLANKLTYYVLFGRKEKDMPTVFVPPVEVRELRSLFTTYELYKKMKTQSRNRIHSLYKQNGICIEKSNLDLKNPMPYLNLFKLPETYQLQVNLLVEDLKYLKARTEEIRNNIEIKGIMFFPKELRRLISIQGISILAAVSLMADVVDVNRFKNVKRFCSYLGTAPRIKESNKTRYLGPINRASRSNTLTLLTQSVNHFKTAGPHLNTFYTRVRTGKYAGKARIALIRKVLVSVYYMLKREKDFKWKNEKLYLKKLDYIEKIMSGKYFTSMTNRNLKKRA